MTPHEAFELGKELERTFVPPKKSKSITIGFAIGVAGIMLGLLPLVKFMLEGGPIIGPMVGSVMMTTGIISFYFSLHAEVRWNKKYDELFEQHHEAAYQKLGK